MSINRAIDEFTEEYKYPICFVFLIVFSSLHYLYDLSRGGPIERLWSTLRESGFMDAMVPEAKGGAGLCLRRVSRRF